MFIVETRSLPTMFPVRGSRTGTARIPTPACGVSMAERNLDISTPVGVLVSPKISGGLTLSRLASPSNLF